LPNILFLWSNSLQSLELQLGKGNLPNNAPLPNYSGENEKTDTELGNKAKRGKHQLTNQFSRKINDNSEFSRALTELGNKTNTIEEKRHIKNNTHLKLKPFISPAGDLTIPFNSDSKHHWWKGKKKVEEIIEEITEK